MTIGEKIKYLRKQKGVTQTELSKLTGIHQVSITKYEKGKMIPQPDQLQKIVDALDVSPIIFFEYNNFKVETQGDLIGLLINLCKSRVLMVKGRRGRNSALVPNTVTFEFAPIIDFLKWEKQYHNYEKLFKKYSVSSNAAEVAALNDLRDIIEKIEIELQCSSMPL